MPQYLSKTLSGILVICSGLSGCNSAWSINQPLLGENVPTSTLSQASTPTELANLEESIHQQINQYRQSKNLPPLTVDTTISQQARLHSEAMSRGDVPFSHDGFDQRIRAIAPSIPYSRAAENVAYNQGYSRPDAQAVQGWLNSSGHRQNIEGEFDLTGIGVSKSSKGEYFFTQIFIRRR